MNRREPVDDAHRHRDAEDDRQREREAGHGQDELPHARGVVDAQGVLERRRPLGARPVLHLDRDLPDPPVDDRDQCCGDHRGEQRQGGADLEVADGQDRVRLASRCDPRGEVRGDFRALGD